MSRVGRMVVELEHRSLSGALSFLYLIPFLFDILVPNLPPSMETLGRHALTEPHCATR
jgi:hypothetical protein